MIQEDQIAQVSVNGQTYKVNDFILAQHGPSTEQEVFRIASIIKPETAEAQQQLSCVRFLPPEQVLGGRQPFHGDKELIESDEVVLLPTSAVKGRCRVLSLDKFQQLNRVGALDFFARYGYQVAQEQFVPSRVPVYCVCESPYNPDKFMVQCSACLEWFHPECLQCSIRAVGARSNWTCPSCTPDDEGGAADDAMETGP